MTMAARLQECLQQNQSHYELLPHEHSHSSPETARLAGVPPEALAKSVILDDTAGRRVMAVIPASRQIDLDKVRELTQRSWHLVRESEFGDDFEGCEIGAIPAVGSAFGMDTLIDQALLEGQDVYFEAGDHEDLVHMSTEQYLRLMPQAQRGALSA
jgi:Ala-tRNA(Pro) deacylase